jgi:hypothetical protein
MLVVLNISGLDLVDGTPVLDVKPYVPHYVSAERTCCCDFRSGSAEVLKQNVMKESDETATCSDEISIRSSEKQKKLLHDRDQL